MQFETSLDGTPRVVQGSVYPIDLFIEPFPYTRLNINSRWTSGPESQEARYIAWKEQIGDLFHQLDYQDHLQGLPFSEPLLLSGSFYLKENWVGKDIDNLIKGVVDALNPKRRKDWSGLKTFAWIDDKQVRAYGSFVSYPSINREASINLSVVPMWGRMDPGLNTLSGTLTKEGNQWAILSRYEIKDQHTSVEYLWYIDLHGLSDEHLGKSLTVFVHPQSLNGVFRCFWTKEALLTYVLGSRLGGYSTDFIWSLGINGKGTSAKAKGFSSAFSERYGDLSTYLESLAYDPVVFEATAREFCERYSIPWGRVRSDLWLVQPSDYAKVVTKLWKK
jgi:hypothetical protein